MSRVKPWTDEEIGFLLDHEHLTARQAGEELGRGMQSVKHMRDKLRQGWSPVKEAWTESETDYIRTTAHMTARQVAANLGRSYHGVVYMRQILAATEGVKFGEGGSRKNPHEVGRRRLLAKSCPKCGPLLEASWFGFNKTRWRSACMRCVPPQKRVRKQDDGSGKRAYEKFQAITREHATRSGEPWVEADHEVLRDPDLTILSKALKLGRTWAATAHACSSNGYVSKVGKGDPEKGRWVIDNPNDVPPVQQQQAA